MKSKLLSLLIVPFISLGIALVGAIPALAASPFDDTVQLTESINLYFYDSNREPIDLTINWSDFLFQGLDGPADRYDIACTDEYLQSFADRIDWAVGGIEGSGTRIPQAERNSDEPNAVSIYWTVDETANIYGKFIQDTVDISSFRLVSDSPTDVLRGVSIYSATDYEGELIVQCSGVSNLSNHPSSSAVLSQIPSWRQPLNHSKLFLSTFPVEYPDGYEGPDIPQTGGPVIPTTEQSDAVPSWYVSRIINYEATIHDNNFNTFDGIQWTCADELAPVLHWTVIGTEFNESGTQSPTAQIDLNLPNTGQEETYTVSGYYECGDDDPHFTSVGRITFKVDRLGNQTFNLFEECFKSDFPYIDPEACIENFFIVINLMVFQEIDFGPGWSLPASDCFTLTTLHTWLNLNNNVVCKQFPSYVRTVVTPFISFALGLFTIRFIASRSREDF